MTVKLLKLLAAFAAGAATHYLLRSRSEKQTDEEAAQPTTTYELDHEEAVIDGAEAAPVECRARVEEAMRAMDFMTLQGASRVTFCTEDGQKLKFHIPGENGAYLAKGDEGLLEYREQTFISFVKDSGEVVGAMYHIPAEDTEA